MDLMKVVLLALLILATGMIAGMMLQKCSVTEKQPATVRTIEKDTVIRILPGQPVVIKAKARVIRTRDTIIGAAPFRAALDTVYLRDTIKAAYEWPGNFFSLDIRRMEDSVRVRKEVVIEKELEQRPWWEAPLYVISGAAAGYLVSKIK